MKNMTKTILCVLIILLMFSPAVLSGKFRVQEEKKVTLVIGGDSVFFKKESGLPQIELFCTGYFYSEKILSNDICLYSFVVVSHTHNPQMSYNLQYALSRKSGDTIMIRHFPRKRVKLMAKIYGMTETSVNICIYKVFEE